jgi:hypothetical protein
MTDNRTSGLALLAGQAGLLLTLSLHPSGSISLAQIDVMAHKLVAVHSIALAALPFMLLGALGLSWALSSPNRLGIVAFVFYGFAIAAMLSGILVDGLVTPSIMRQVAASPAASDAWRMIFRYNGFLDMAFVHVSLVASAVAIVIWSVAILRSAMLSHRVGVYGVILGAMIPVAVFSGILGSEHAISGLVFGQMTWFVIVGVMLFRLPNQEIAVAPSAAT